MKTIRSQRHQIRDKIKSHSAASMTNDMYMIMEYTVTLMVITRYNLVHFLVLSSANQYPIKLRSF